MANILNPDDVYAFLKANGYPTQYNDGLRAYLRVFYSLPDASLAELFSKYITEHGLDLSAPAVAGDKLLLENGIDFILMEDGLSFILME